MPKTRRLLTRMSKGELSPLLEGSSDLQSYYEGCSTLENFKILRQGGITRWEGTRMVSEVKDSTKDTILLPFEYSVNDAYILEVGDLYIRVYKNGVRVNTSAAGPAVEIVTPFAVADIRSIHRTQSADVLFLFHNSYQQRKLNRLSDTSWALTTQNSNPPPTFEADTDLADTLGVGANTGTGIKMHAGSAVFLAADVGRYVVAGAGRGVITAVDSTSQVTVDIQDAFPATITAGPNQVTTTVGTTFNSVAHGLAAGDYISITSGAQAGQVRKVASITSPDIVVMDAAFPADIAVAATWNKVLAIASGGWKLHLSPQTTLDPDISTPIGARVTLVAGAAAFRAADVGKYIVVYSGTVLITTFDSTTQVKGTLLSTMSDTTLANPAATAAGTWTLEVSSWSAANGYPRTGEFFQGGLYEAASTAQPTTIWRSRADDYDNFSTGIKASDGLEYTIASREVNRIEFLIEKGQGLFVGTTGSEQRFIGSGNQNAIIGGDNIPAVEKFATNGVMPVQPIMVRKTALYIDRSRRKVMGVGYDITTDGDIDTELSVGSEHITTSGVRLGPMAFQRRKDPRLFFVREDGTLVAMTFFPEQKVVAFSRRTTQGTFESVAVIPNVNGGDDEVWVIAKRTINGTTKRFVEVFDPDYQTDCSAGYVGSATTAFPYFSHLTGETVDVLVDTVSTTNTVLGFLGTQVVTGGALTTTDAAVQLTAGLHYDSTCTTMRPAVPGQVIDGIPRSWDSLFVRVKDSIGGTINGERMLYAPSNMDAITPYTGDVKVTTQSTDTDGRVTVLQDQPYPLTILAIFGTLNLGEAD